jgi:GLPGLI family protein
MMISSKFKINILSIILTFYCGNSAFSQITSGKIVFERKTNLMKKFTDERTKKWITEENKYNIDVFELYFNDSISVFIPAEEETGKRGMGWATAKNSVVQNIKTGTRLSVLNIWGENAYVQDSLINREWKITESKRKIGSYMCQKAIYKMNDSVTIYAWYSQEIIPAIGPETFQGLPGAILGLATEDGGVVYFAKSYEALKPDFDFVKITPKAGKKTYSHEELKTKLKADFENKPWGKGLVDDMFTW